MEKICVTGASGFIGRSICKSLNSSGKFVKGFVRNVDSFLDLEKIEYEIIGDISSNIDWKKKLYGNDIIIHCAGIGSLKKKNNDKDFFYSVNVEGTKRLAEDAIKAGIKRLIFLSSIKVNGEKTFKSNGNKQFTINDSPDPQDKYALSKLHAENILWDISARSNLEVVVVRLPLGYGPGVKGNLFKLIKLINLGIPLPFSKINNKRSFIGIDNLVDLLFSCIHHPGAAGKTFLASDGKDLSTPELINLISSALGTKSSLFPLPISILNFIGKIIGRKEDMERLTGSLQVDISQTINLLNWKPPISVEDGIEKMVKFK